MHGTRAAKAAKKANRYYSGPPSDHFDGAIFFNPGGEPPGKAMDLLKWQLSHGRAKWPDRFPPPVAAARPDPRVEGEGLRVTMVGHATLLVQTAGLNILTDPVWSERCSPFSFAGPRRVNEPGIAFADLPKIDVVLSEPQPLRPSRPCDAEAAAGDPRPAGRDAARQRHDRQEGGSRRCAWRCATGARASRPAARPSISSRRITGRRAASTTGAWRCGRPSWSRRRRERSTMSATPAFIPASTTARLPRNTAASGWPSCRSAPTSRAGS